MNQIKELTQEMTQELEDLIERLRSKYTEVDELQIALFLNEYSDAWLQIIQATSLKNNQFGL
jgi:biotin-(acetyl-CoA carboxylase) ligase